MLRHDPIVVCAALLVGCGGAGFILKTPIEDRCQESGLQGCPELAEGAIAYIEGDTANGRDSLLRGAAKNSPDQVKSFAAALKGLSEIPGTKDYMGPVMEIVDLLTEDAKKSAALAKPAKKAPKPDAEEDEPEEEPEVKPRPKRQRAIAATIESHEPEPDRLITADADPTRIERGFVAPAMHPDRFPCANGSFCVRVPLGTIVVTDISAADGCPVDLFVAAGPKSSELSAASWSVSARQGVHGARLLVKKDEAIFLGVSGARGGQDPRCAITWSGFRPYDTKGDS